MWIRVNTLGRSWMTDQHSKKKDNPNLQMVWSQILDIRDDITEIKMDIVWLKDVTTKLEKRLWQIPFKIFIGIVASTLALFIANLLSRGL